jgi:hypothetical protein
MGKFQFKGVDDGRYVLEVRKSGFVQSHDHGGPSNVTIVNGQNMDNVRIVLGAQGSISGRVFDENGDARTNTYVQAVQPKFINGRMRLSTCETANGKGVKTDENGSYRLFGLDPGNYYVAVEMSSNCFDFARYYPSALDPANGVALSVSEGTELQGIDLHLPELKMYSVQFRVISAFPLANDPLAIFQVVRKGQNGLEKTEKMIRQNGIRTISDGTREISLPMGSYDLYSSARTGTAVGRLSFVVVDRDLDAGTLVVLPSTTIKGRISGADGQLPVSTHVTGDGYRGLQVRLEPKDSRDPIFAGPSIARTAPDGTFAFEGTTVSYGTFGTVAAGRYKIEIIGLPPDYYIVSAKYDGRSLDDLDLEIDGEAEAELNIVVGSPGGIVQGIVRDNSDKPAADCKVILIPGPTRRNNSGFFKVGSSDQLGSFSIKGVVPGEYELLALEDVDNGAWEDPEFLRDIEVQASKVKIEKGITNFITLRLIKSR